MSPLDHETQRKIVLKLIHRPGSSFNELWNKEGESNSFAYHMAKLEEQRIISKTDGRYSLTDEGKKLSAFIEGDTGGKAEFPTLTIILIIKRGDKILTQKRLKEPFYGLWSFVSGKINFGQNMFECATRDLLEETGLQAHGWAFRGIEQTKTFEGEKLLYHHYLLWVETENPDGTLKERTHKAENAWMTLEEYMRSEGFPREWVYHIMHAKRPVLVEAERYMQNGKFTGGKTISFKEL